MTFLRSISPITGKFAAPVSKTFTYTYKATDDAHSLTAEPVGETVRQSMNHVPFRHAVPCRPDCSAAVLILVVVEQLQAPHVPRIV